MCPLDPQYPNAHIERKIAANLAEKAEKAMPQYSDDISRVSSVWSAHRHHFIGEDENYVSCLRCGAMYQLMALANDPTRGEYLASNGDEPKDCTGNTSMGHGDPVERGDDSDDPNYAHDCNCLFCA